MTKIILTGILFLMSNLIVSQNNELLTAFEQSYSHEKNLEYDKAANDLELIYLKHISNYEINLRLGWLKYSAGEFKQSENYYDKAMELKPLALEAIYGKILPMIAEGRYSKISRLANKALEIAPNDSKAEYYIGLAEYYDKNYSKAEKYLEKAINKYPFDLDIILMMGWTKFALGKKNEAKSLFLVAQRNSPQNQRVKLALDLINK